MMAPLNSTGEKTSTLSTRVALTYIRPFAVFSVIFSRGRSLPVFFVILHCFVKSRKPEPVIRLRIVAGDCLCRNIIGCARPVRECNNIDIRHREVHSNWLHFKVFAFFAGAHDERNSCCCCEVAVGRAINDDLCVDEGAACLVLDDDADDGVAFQNRTRNQRLE